MKLLLASNGGFLMDHGYNLLGIPASEMKIGYVTTASKAVDDLRYIENHRRVMRERGYDFHEIDIEGKSKQELHDFFADKNIIHVEGGNTFYLLKAVKESGFDTVLKDLLAQGKVYIGSSAGAYILCPTIEVSTWSKPPEDPRRLTDLTALGLIPFILKVHYKPEERDMVLREMNNLKYPITILMDGQGILVEDGTYTFVGEGEEVILK